MRWLLLKFRQTLGLALLGAGLIGGVLGACWSALYARAWLVGDGLEENDVRLWKICAVAGTAGLAACAAGWVLWRGRDFRLAATPSPGGRAASRGAFQTAMWLALAGKILWNGTPGPLGHRLGWVALGTAGFYLGVHAIFLLHELGHLGAAKLLGMDLYAIQIGGGPRWWGRRLAGGLRVEWRAWISGAFVWVLTREEAGYRRRRWLFVLGGPLAHALVCGALGWAWWHGAPAGGSIDDLPSLAGAVQFELLGFAGLSLVLSLLPHRVAAGGSPAWSDGYQLCSIPRATSEAVREKVIASTLYHAEARWAGGRGPEAGRLVRELLARYPGHGENCPIEARLLRHEGRYAEAARLLGQGLERADLSGERRAAWQGERFAAMAQAGGAPEARRFCAECLRAVPPAQRAHLLDTFSTAVIFEALPAHLPDADAWSADMVALEPGVATFQATRASVLIERGELAAGEKMWRAVLGRPVVGAVDAALGALYLGIAAKRGGRAREARKWRARAEGFILFPMPWFERRVARELGQI